jgi:CheY-like chemotaxis protein
MRQALDWLATAARRFAHMESRDSSPLAVIGLIAGERDRQILHGVCSRHRWTVAFADNCDQARSALDRMEAPVVLCDRDLGGDDWRRVVEALAASPQPACILLLSKVVDDYLREELVRSGGFDVLRKPLREDEVAHAVRLAWTYWNTTPSARRRSA